MDSPNIVDDQSQKGDELTIAYQKVFSGPEGEKVLNHLMYTYGVFFGTADTEGNPHVMYYNEGRRSVVVDILERVDCDLDKIRKSREESLSEF